MKNFWVRVFLTTFIISGCSTIEPDTVERDRFDYNTALMESLSVPMYLLCIVGCVIAVCF